MSKSMLFVHNRYIKDSYFIVIYKIISSIFIFLYLGNFNNNYLLSSDSILQGNSIKYDDYLMINRGMTKLQVEEVLGTSVIKNHFNNNWIYVRLENVKSKIMEDILLITFDELQRVKSVSWTTYSDDEILFQSKK